MRLRVAILLAALLCVPRLASAATIGTFDWVYDELFATGSSFNVANESVDTFTSVFVDLYAPLAPDPFQSLSLGNVAAGTTAQSIDDLSLLLVPLDLARAQLRFTFGTEAVVVQLLAGALVGEPGNVLFGSIDIEAPDVSPTPTPEPSTLALLLAGVGIGAWRAGFARRGAARQRPGAGESPQRI